MQGWRDYKPLLFVFQEHLQCFVLKALYYLVKPAQRKTLFCHCHHNDGTNLSVSGLCSLYWETKIPHILFFLLLQALSGVQLCQMGMAIALKKLEALKKLLTKQDLTLPEIPPHPWCFALKPASGGFSSILKILDTCRRSVQWSWACPPLVVFFKNQSVLKKAADTELWIWLWLLASFSGPAFLKYWPTAAFASCVWVVIDSCASLSPWQTFNPRSKLFYYDYLQSPIPSKCSELSWGEELKYNF